MTRATVNTPNGRIVRFGVQGGSAIYDMSALEALRFATDLQDAARKVIDAAAKRANSGEHVSRASLLPEADKRGLSRQTFGRPCWGCGTTLDTELAFAEHFAISAADIRAGHWNLGYCPNRIATHKNESN